jgi:hypothetical protein
MDTFLATQLQISNYQVLLLLVLSTLVLIIGQPKLALLVNYCFIIYWVYVTPIDLFNHDTFYTLTNGSIAIYSCGLVMVLLGLFCIFFTEA